jgi:hypothetical protein
MHLMIGMSIGGFLLTAKLPDRMASIPRARCYLAYPFYLLARHLLAYGRRHEYPGQGSCVKLAIAVRS